MEAISQSEPPSDVSPRQARHQFVQYKRGRVKDSTVRAYKYPLKHFVEFCEKRGIDDMADVSSYVLESWQEDRREGVKLVTLHNNVKHLRVFIKWCGRQEYVEWGLHDRMTVPDLSTEDAVSDETMRLEQAESILRFLDKYEYGTRTHALFYTIWHTGCRISGAIALDLSDFSVDDETGGGTLNFQNRRYSGTALKNGNGGERIVTIKEDLVDVLNDYINARREATTDDYDREPLFTTPTQRMSRGRTYKDFTALSRPCHISNECPHDREISECEAAESMEKAPGCPSSKSLHPIRRGSITYHIDRGWPKEKLSERVDVSVDVLNKHYDARRKEDKRQGRQEFIDLL